MINASIVVFNHTVSEIKPLVDTLLNSDVVANIYIIDNSPKNEPNFQTLKVTYIFNNKNLGYGAAHNIALRHTIAQLLPYHLVVNPDIAFDPQILSELEKYMDKNSNIGSIMPKVLYPNGETQYLCKLLPTPFDLIFRRFLPSSFTKNRTYKFELRASGYNQIMDVPYLSGCFMFLRTAALQKVGLFDERFFMYPEDMDLTRRIHKQFRTVFYPKATIVHHHAKGSYINGKLLYIHISNMIKYFNKWGWFFDAERREINKKIILKLERK